MSSETKRKLRNFLILIGFFVGILGGFFGVGGGFLAGPMLFWSGMPWNMVVGTILPLIGALLVIARLIG